ncbi:MAG TPA: hypothetical protein VEL47_01800, partial [Myxococcota bacterium]|nr:hypothetical protein [Myxococcota bacterium]
QELTSIAEVVRAYRQSRVVALIADTMPEKWDEVAYAYSKWYPVELEINRELGGVAEEKAFKRVFAEAVNGRAKVICLVYSINVVNCPDEFALAKKNDVLLVMPAHQGNNPKYGVGQEDEHFAYPNVLWAVGHGENKELRNHVDVGPLINIAAKAETGNSFASLYMARFLGFLRSHRPDMSAKEICQAVRSCLELTEETKRWIPNGGIFDSEKALKAVKEYRPENTSAQ